MGQRLHFKLIWLSVAAIATLFVLGWCIEGVLLGLGFAACGFWALAIVLAVGMVAHGRREVQSGRVILELANRKSVFRLLPFFFMDAAFSSALCLFLILNDSAIGMAVGALLLLLTLLKASIFVRCWSRLPRE